MSRRRPLAAALTLALVAPVSALTASAATAAPTHPSARTAPAATAAAAAPAASSIGAKRLARPTPGKGAHVGHDPHTVLVKFKKSASATSRDRAVKRRGASLGRTLPGTSFVTVHTSGAADELASRLSADPSVAEVSLDYVREASATPNDPAYYYGEQDYLKTVRMPGAWDRSKGSLSTVVAVVDTGVNGWHPDLTGRTVAGYNAITNTGIAAGALSDDKGHGTMVAGIIAAETNNNDGIAGVAWNARVMPVKVLNAQGKGTDSDIVEGINWAVSHGARIINLSLGGDTDNPALHDAVRGAVAKGAVVVAAAGNYGDDVPQYPAAYPEAVAVAATDNAGALTDFSTYGSWVDLAAPGWGIVSTGRPDSAGNLYYYGDGTSFSAPIVSGVVALLRSKTPSMTPAQVLARLKATARDAGPRGIDPYYGAGLLDATNALGGGYAADLALPAAGANEPNDVPARAKVVPLGDVYTPSATGTIGIEGDVDWYRYDNPGQQQMTVTVTPAPYDANVPQNLDPLVSLYDSNLRLVARVDQNPPGEAETVTARMGAGTFFVSVRNFNGARVPNQPYSVVVQQQTDGGLLANATHVPSDAWYSPIGVGDVNGDGRADVLAGTVPGSGPVVMDVFLQQAAGGLGAPTSLQTVEASVPRNVVVTDYDGDGLNDVVTATQLGVQVFRQAADHTLSPAEVVPDTADAIQVAVADITGDGLRDLVVSTTTELDLLTGAVDGGFTRTVLGTAPALQLKVADLDRDGRLDVVANTRDAARVLRNTASGWVTDSLTTTALYSLESVEVADLNGDSLLDVAAVGGGNQPSSKLVVWRGVASGGFAAPTATTTIDIPEAIASADVDGDGRQDVVIGHGAWGTVSVLQQRADGTLAGASRSATTTGSHYDVNGIAMADVTGDGRVDAVVDAYPGLDVLGNGAGPTTATTPQFVRSTWPVDFGSGLPITTAPTVTFVRDAVPSTVTASTVRLVNGRTGAAVPATVTYDAAKRTATVKPSTALYDWAPYRLNVSGVKDTSGASMTTVYSSTFRTVDTAPPAVGAFKATGALRAATLTWTAPHVSDLDRYVVRMAAGTTPPANITAGTSAYSGTATRATVSLAQGTTYSFRIWVKDRTGHYSAGSWTRIVGTAESITSNVTTVRKGYAVTVSGKIVRKDTGTGVGGAAMQLYWRRVGTSTWNLTATRTSSSTGTFSYAHKPSASVDYMWVYRGSSTLVGSSSALRRVSVR